MTNRRLSRCPTCDHELDDVARARMGLRNGEILNGLCPGRNGPSDIDHVLHNGHVSPERLIFLEYKRGGLGLTTGQEHLRRSLVGDWEEANTGRLLAVRHRLLNAHSPDADYELQAVVDWVWPERVSA